jgi:hypothetical protein
MEKPKAQVRPKKTAKADTGVAPQKETPKPRSIEEKTSAYTFEQIVDDLSNGVSLTEVAGRIGISAGNLCEWIAKEPERSARAREARVYAARIWDDKAVEAIEQASDPFQLARAKELAHHYRWRASKTAPKDYGEKVLNEHTGANGGAIQVESRVTFVRPAPRVED